MSGRPGGRRLTASLVAVTALSACAAVHGPAAGRDRPPPNPDGVVALGVAGSVVYARTLAGRLRAWDLTTGALRTLDRSHVAALATDGAVALSFRSRREADAILEAWEPASGRQLARHVFPHGVRQVLGVARGLAVLEVGLAVYTNPFGGVMQMLPPVSELVAWDLGSGTIERLPYQRCDEVSLSADGRRFTCGLGVIDRAAPAVDGPPAVAPDWDEPSDDEGGHHCPKCDVVPTIYLLSVWLSRDGRSMVFSYTGFDKHDEWRLERWSRDETGKTRGRVDRLASGPERGSEDVLAASSDGTVIVTSAAHRQLVVRRAPGYETARLIAPRASAAVFTGDDTRFVTGHEDGALRLWEASTGRLVVVSGR